MFKNKCYCLKNVIQYPYLINSFILLKMLTDNKKFIIKSFFITNSYMMYVISYYKNNFS